MDIRSFFSPKSGGGGGTSSKPKSSGGSASASKKKDARKGKSSPEKSPPGSNNKAVGKQKMEITSKKKRGAGNDDDDNVVEEVVPTSALKKKKTQGNKKGDARSSSGDGVVEIVPSPKHERLKSSRSTTKKRKVEDEDETMAMDKDEDAAGARSGQEGGRRGSDKAMPSPCATASKKASTRDRAESPQRSSLRGKRSRGSGKKVLYCEDSDEDGGGEDDDEDAYNEDADGEEDDDDHDDADKEEEDFKNGKRSSSLSRKRKSTTSSGSGGGGGGSGGAKTKRRSTDGTDSSSATATLKKSCPAKNNVVELANTSSDEQEEVKPPPRKKPEKAKAPTEKDSTSAKKSGGGGGGGGAGGGFRPPWMGGSRQAPPNEGNKEVPKGADQCLSGKTFVVSGVLDSLGREAAEDLIKEYGGKVTGSVSSKTAFLLLGSVLDDGRPPEEGSKYKKAQQHKTKIIDEDGLFKMLRDSNPGGRGSSASSTPTAASAATGASKKPGVANPYAKAAVANPYGSFTAKKATPNPYAAMASKRGAESGGAKSPAKVSRNGKGSSSSSTPSVLNKPGQMWVDKHKPQATKDIIGHTGQVTKLQTWLRNWENWHLKANGPKPPQGKDNPGARAALLSGVPGVGKSSTATLVAKEMGYHVFELNASDTRNKSSLSVELASVIGNQCLNFTAEGRSRSSSSSSKKGGGSKKSSSSGGGGFKKQLVVMDEVDGMGGSDRGGIQELIALIKKAKVPIIAICNDRQHQKIRSLVNHCYDLRFQRPQKATIAKRVKAIAKMEGMDVDDNAAEMLVEANGNDIRQVLHALQMWSRKSSKLSYMNLKGGLAAIEKDKVQRCGPFEAARSILGGERTPLKERYEAFFTDYSLLPLLVHQNYPSSLMKIDPSTRTDVTMRAAAACSDADIISGKMRGDVQHWELLPAQAALNVRVGSIGAGSLGFPEFPKWLGNYSRENKRRRLLGELSTHLNASVSGGPEAVRLSYVHFLKTVLTRPLRERGAEGAQECVDMLEEYGLSRDDLFEIMPEFQLSSTGMKHPPPDVFGCLDGKTKSAVTRCYNSISHKSQALVEAMQAPKKKKKAKAPPKSLAMESEEEDEEEEDEEEEDLSAFKKKGSRGKATPKAKSKTKGKK